MVIRNVRKTNKENRTNIYISAEREKLLNTVSLTLLTGVNKPNKQLLPNGFDVIPTTMFSVTHNVLFVVMIFNAHASFLANDTELFVQFSCFFQAVVSEIACEKNNPIGKRGAHCFSEICIPAVPVSHSVPQFPFL